MPLQVELKRASSRMNISKYFATAQVYFNFTRITKFLNAYVQLFNRLKSHSNSPESAIANTSSHHGVLLGSAIGRALIKS